MAQRPREGRESGAAGQAWWSRPAGTPIAGFDDWAVIADAFRPPLTSVDMNLKELGREAGRRLIDLIAGNELRGVRRIPCTLVVRESCGASSRAARNPKGGI